MIHRGDIDGDHSRVQWGRWRRWDLQMIVAMTNPRSAGTLIDAVDSVTLPPIRSSVPYVFVPFVVYAPFDGFRDAVDLYCARALRYPLMVNIPRAGVRGCAGGIGGVVAIVVRIFRFV